MDFQILDADYKLVRDVEPVIRLFGRSADGKSVCCLVPGFEPYFYARPKASLAGGVESVSEYLRERYPQIKRIETVERFEPVGYQTQKKTMFKIFVYSPKNVPEIRDDVAREPGVEEIYESDILFRNRYLVDKDLGGMAWASASDDGSVSEEDAAALKTLLPSRCDCVICTQNVAPLERISNAPLRYMAFDIECLPENGNMPTPDKSPVILISFAFEPAFNGFNTMVLAAKPKPEESGVPMPGDDVVWIGDEEALLRKFFDIIAEYDPDVLTGYNINEFDLPYIMQRVEALRKSGIRIPPETGRDKSSVYIRKFGLSSKVEILGRVVADALPLIRRSYSLKQYTLRTVAKELLGREKLDVAPSMMEEYWKDDGEKLFRFIDYSRRDSELAIELLLDLKLLHKFVALAQITNSVLSEVLSGGQTSMVEQVMTREYNKRGRVMPVKPGGDEFEERDADDEGLKGGAVLDPMRGLHENVIILDYKSLYPTIMMAHNLCYTTVLKDGTDIRALGLSEADIITTPSGGRFVKDSVSKGIVPSILEDLLDRRIQTKKKMKAATDEHEIFALDATQMALKILLNSYYGYSGYARARLYSMELANSVTAIGRENILNTRRIITEEIGLVFIHDGKALLESELRAAGIDPFSKDVVLIRPRVVYGDTDSVFVHCTADGGGEFSEGALTLEMAALAGSRLAAIVTSSLPRPMELEFEAIARRVVLIAKKRYAQWLFEPSGDGWKDKIKVKGMETVRRDWCGLTSFTLSRILELVLKEGDVDGAVRLVKSTIAAVRTLDLQANPEFLEKLILTKNYSKSADNYRSKQPHLMVVEKIKNRTGAAPPIGTRVPFVVIAGKGLFADRAEDPEYVMAHNIPIDVDYYINKQLLPPVERILEVFGVDMSSLDRFRQRGLFDFGTPSSPAAADDPDEPVDAGPSMNRRIKEESANTSDIVSKEKPAKSASVAPGLDMEAAFGVRRKSAVSPFADSETSAALPISDPETSAASPISDPETSAASPISDPASAVGNASDGVSSPEDERPAPVIESAASDAEAPPAGNKKPPKSGQFSLFDF